MKFNRRNIIIPKCGKNLKC